MPPEAYDAQLYRIGSHTTFKDENQCEIRGIIYNRWSYPDKIILKIALDSGGFYEATLLRTNIL